MNNKTIIILGAVGTLAFILFRKIRGYADMAQQISFVPKVYDKPKISLSKLTIPICIDITNPTAEKAKVTVLQGYAIIAGREVAKVDVPEDGATVTIAPNTTSRLKGLSIAIPINNLLTTILNNLNDLMSKDFTKVISSTSLQFAVTVNGLATISGNMAFDKQTALGSLGLTASSKRNIRPLSDYASLIPPRTELRHDDAVRMSSATPEQTVAFMHQVIRETTADTTRLAQSLQGSTLKSTLQNIWNFVYQHIQYVPDSAVMEQVRRPLRTLYDQKGDCDCYATLIGSILTNIGIPFSLRIAKYNGRSYFQHVYVVVKDGGKELVVDPVVDKCFYEKKPSEKKDFPC